MKEKTDLRQALSYIDPAALSYQEWVSVGMGLKEDDNDVLINGSAFNAALCGLDFLNYGVDKDGDPKNVALVMRELADAIILGWKNNQRALEIKDDDRLVFGVFTKDDYEENGSAEALNAEGQVIEGLYAAGELVGLANDWSQEMDDDGETAEISKEQFMERMELESIEVRADGSFEFWFADGDMFYGHSIHVSGDMENGPDAASMEG